MALLFVDSFDHYSASESLLKWTSSRNGSFTPSAGNGRFGSSAWSGNNARWTTKNLSANYATLIVGMALRVESGMDDAVLSFLDTGSFQTELRYNTTTSEFRFTRNGTLITGSTVSYIMPPGVSHYIEVKVTFDNASGTLDLHIDDNQMLSLTGKDTQNTNAWANQLRIGSAADNANTIYIDDFYVADTSGGVNDDFLGDVRIQYRKPNGNGNSSQLVGSDSNSTDNYLLVDETTPNDDTDYVGSATPGDKDTYTYEDLTAVSGSVYGVVILPDAKKTDVGARSIKTIARLSGTETDGPEQSLSTTYQYLYDIRETKPGGGSWSISDVNNAEFGVKVFA